MSQLLIRITDAHERDLVDFATELVPHLQSQNISVSLEKNCEGTDTLLDIGLPKNKFPTAKKRLLYTLVNSETAPNWFIEAAKSYDAVFVPTACSKEALKPLLCHEVSIPLGEQYFDTDIQPNDTFESKGLQAFPVRIIAPLERNNRTNFAASLFYYAKLSELLGPKRACLLTFSKDRKQVAMHEAQELFELIKNDLINKGYIGHTDYHWFHSSPSDASSDARFLKMGTHYLSTSCHEGYDSIALRAAALGLSLFLPFHSSYMSMFPSDVVHFLPPCEKVLANEVGDSHGLYQDTHWYNCDAEAALHIIAANIIDPSLSSLKIEMCRHHVKQFSWEQTLATLLEYIK